MNRADLAAAALVAALALAWGAPTLRAGFEGPYDEGNILCAAVRVADGQVPYRDFWYLHGPGTPYLLGGAFRLFGTTLATERGVKLAVVVFSSVLLFTLARGVAPRWLAAAAALLFVVSPAQTLSLRPRDLGVAGALATVMAALAAARSGPRRIAWGCGALAGLTACFKQDAGVYAVIAAVSVLGATAWREAPAGRRVRALSMGVLLPVGVPACAVFLIVLAGLASAGALPDFVAQAVVFPMTEFPRFRALPLSLRLAKAGVAFAGGSSARSLFDAFLPPSLFLGMAVTSLAAALRGGTRWVRGEANGGARTGLLCGVAGLLFLNVARVRLDPEHLLPAVPFALVSALFLVSRREGGRSLTAHGWLGGACLAGMLVVSLPSARERLRLFGGEAVAAPTSLARAPEWRDLDPDLVRIARIVSERTGHRERIFVGNTRHDALGYDAPLVYFLADRMGATRYDNLHPGVVTTLAVQEEMVRDLERRGTKLVVLWDGPPLREPNESAISSGVFLLDRFLKGRFRETARFGRYRVLEREPVSAAPVSSAER